MNSETELNTHSNTFQNEIEVHEIQMSGVRDYYTILTIAT